MQNEFLSKGDIHCYYHHYYYSVSWARYCTVFLYNGLAEMLLPDSPIDGFSSVFKRSSLCTSQCRSYLILLFVVVYMSVQVIPYPAVRRCVHLIACHTLSCDSSLSTAQCRSHVAYPAIPFAWLKCLRMCARCIRS